MQGTPRPPDLVRSAGDDTTSLRLLRALWRTAVRALRFSFIVLLVALPIPLPAFVAHLVRGQRKRAEVTQVERKN